jgi:hypothetical protein
MVQTKVIKPSDYLLPHADFRRHQLESIQWLYKQEGNVILAAPTGCHAPGQGILMYDGSVQAVERLSVGSQLMGPDSQPRTILELTSGYDEMYEIIPTKGTPFIVNAHHILTLQRTRLRSKHTSNHRRRMETPTIDVMLSDWVTWSKYQKHIYKLFRVPVEFEYRPLLPVNPYFLGVILGDGNVTRGSVTITTQDPEIVDEIYRQSKLWSVLVHAHEGSSGAAMNYSLRNGYRGGIKNPLMAKIEQLGLRGHNSSNKFIPQKYKCAGRESRLEILAGLLDTDGSLGSNCFDYISKSPQLADDVVFVARSLGFSAYVNPCSKRDQHGRGGVYYRVSISGDVAQIPCRLPRKKSAERKQIKSVLRTGFSVRSLGIGPYYGFTLDGDGRYLLDDFTVTHNSGKTSFAKALSREFKTVALVKTKSLQAQYGEAYDFDVLYGKRNYFCVDAPDESFGVTCDDCPFENMYDCAVQSSCLYLDAKRTALNSNAAALNYAYWMTTRIFRAKVEALVMDECQLLPQIVLDFVGTTIDQRLLDEYNLPNFVVIDPRWGNSKDHAVTWLKRCIRQLTKHVERLESVQDDSLEHTRALKKARGLMEKMTITEQALGGEGDWYIRSGLDALKRRNGDEPGFICKPFSARHDFPRYFMHGSRLNMLMSATVGNPDVLAEELGIESFAFRSVPNQFTPEERRIWDLGAPKINYRAFKQDPQLLEHQAKVIYDAIVSLNPAWSGIIHVNAIYQAQNLAAELGKLGLEHRIYVPEVGLGTNEVLQQWEYRKKLVKNSIIVTWNMWEGVDLFDDQICIVAKVPYGNLGSEYERLKFNQNRRFYTQEAAWKLVQGLGRIRRGRPEDYGDNKFVAIADGSFKNITTYMDKDITDSIEVWNG